MSEWAAFQSSQSCFGLHRILCIGRDPQRSIIKSSLYVYGLSRDQTTTLVLLTPCSAQLSYSQGLIVNQSTVQAPLGSRWNKEVHNRQLPSRDPWEVERKDNWIESCWHGTDGATETREAHGRCFHTVKNLCKKSSALCCTTAGSSSAILVIAIAIN